MEGDSSSGLVLKLCGKEFMSMWKDLLLLNINSNFLHFNFINLTNNFSSSIKVGNYTVQKDNSHEWD